MSIRKNKIPRDQVTLALIIMDVQLRGSVTYKTLLLIMFVCPINNSYGDLGHDHKPSLSSDSPIAAVILLVVF